MDKISSLGMPPVSPQEIFKKSKRQSLGMPKASPSSSIKIPGFFQTLHFYCFMHNCVVLGASLFLFLVFICLVFLNKLVGPPYSYILSNKLVWIGKSRKSSCLSGKKELVFYCGLCFVMPCLILFWLYA